MRRLLTCLILAAPSLLGCSTMPPNTWTLPVKAAPPSLAGRRECGPPIRIAVVPFREARQPTNPSMGVVAWLMLGTFVSPDYEDVVTYGPRDPARPQDYVHDDERIFAAVLQRELENTGCFDTVAFDPRFPYAYDVVIGGQIIGAGKRVEAPFVPVPAWVGTIVAGTLASRGFVVEVELAASAPGAKPFLHYGVQGACVAAECGPSAAGRASGFGAALTNGYAPFVRDFRGYVASRTPAFWQRVSEARFKRFAVERDPELESIAAAARRSDRCREVYEEELATRSASLAAMFEDLSTEERSWAARSWERADDEVRRSNEVAGVALAAGDQELARADAWQRRRNAESELAEAYSRDHGSGFFGSLLGLLDTESKESTARSARDDEAKARARETRLIARANSDMAKARQAVADIRNKDGGGEESVRAWSSYYASQRRPLTSLAERCR